MNKVILVGRLTADVELKRTANDVPVARFTIAINRSHQKDITDFIDCTAWRGIAEFISKYFKKGNMIAIVGSITTGVWDDENGNKRKRVDVVVDEAYFTGGKNDGSRATASTCSAANEHNISAPASSDVDPDDDLPF